MTDDTGLLDTNSSRQGFSFEHETKMKERKAYENFSAIQTEAGDAKLALECCLG